MHVLQVAWQATNLLVVASKKIPSGLSVASLAIHLFPTVVEVRKNPVLQAVMVIPAAAIVQVLALTPQLTQVKSGAEAERADWSTKVSLQTHSP